MHVGSVFHHMNMQIGFSKQWKWQNTTDCAETVTSVSLTARPQSPHGMLVSVGQSIFPQTGSLDHPSDVEITWCSVFRSCEVSGTWASPPFFFPQTGSLDPPRYYQLVSGLMAAADKRHVFHSLISMHRNGSVWYLHARFGRK